MIIKQPHSYKNINYKHKINASKCNKLHLYFECYNNIENFLNLFNQTDFSKVSTQVKDSLFEKHAYIKIQNNYNNLTYEIANGFNLQNDYGNNLILIDTKQSGFIQFLETKIVIFVDNNYYEIPFIKSDSIDYIVNEINRISRINAKCLNSGNCGELFITEKIYFGKPIIIPSKYDNKIHTVELLADIQNGFGAIAYDGLTQTFKLPTDITDWSIYINADYKNLELDIDSYGSAELIDNQIISNHNPKLIIIEAHKILNCKDTEVEDPYDCTIGRLNSIFEKLQNTDYVPVNWKDIHDWKLKNKNLPKRCFNIMMDDFPVDNYIDEYKRSIFKKYNVHPGFAIALPRTMDKNDDIILDHEIIPRDYYLGDRQSLLNQLLNDCTLTCHADHRRMGDDNPIDILSKLQNDSDKCKLWNINTDILVYPYGSVSKHLIKYLEISPFNLGIHIQVQPYNCHALNNYYLTRLNIGNYIPLNNILEKIK